MFILVVLIVCSVSQQILCKNSCKHSNLDLKMKALSKTLGEPRAKWPENEEQKLKFCREMHEASNRAKFFKKKCYQGISKSYMKFTIHALEDRNIKLSCKSQEEMKRFLKRGKCGNKGKSGTTKCWTDWIDKLTMINATKTEDKVPFLCCSLHEWKKCNLDVYRGLGSKVCSKKSINGFDTYMQRSIAEPINTIFCHDHYTYDSKVCRKMSKLTSQTTPGQKPKYKTPFPIILEISDSL